MCVCGVMWLVCACACACVGMHVCSFGDDEVYEISRRLTPGIESVVKATDVCIEKL